MSPSIPFRTLPPLEITRLLLAPEKPTARAPEFDQKELVPVTCTELFEEVEAFPMYPKVFRTVPPLEMTMLLLVPELPTIRFVKLVTRVFVFSTVRLLPSVTPLEDPT